MSKILKIGRRKSNRLVDESTNRNQFSQNTSELDSKSVSAQAVYQPLSIDEIREAKEFQESMLLLSEGKLRPSIKGFIEHVRKVTSLNN